MGEAVFGLFLMVIVGGLIGFFVWAGNKQDAYKAARRANVKAKFAEEGDAPKGIYHGKLGVFGGAAAIVYVGAKGVMIDAYKQSEPVWIPYEEVYAVNARRPAIPQMLNINASALMANALTQAQVGNTVTFTVDAVHRTIDIVIGQLGPNLAAELEDEVLRAIYARTGKRVD